MNFKELFAKKNLYGFGLITLLVIGFSVYAELDPVSLARLTVEDSVIEWSSALLFAVSGIAFLLAARRSSYLSGSGNKWLYFFIICWGLLMLVFAGEEISWGQRVFGFSTPEAVESVNVQKEFNLHNLGVLQSAKYTLLSLMMFVTGVLLPGVALFDSGKKFFRKIGMPVLPLCYSAFFIWSYLFGKYYYNALPIDAASEVRELLLAMGMAAFGLHGIWRSNDLFRISRE